MKTVFKNCILLDGTKNMAPIEYTDVVTDGDKIVFIGKAEIGAGDRVFDLNGKYLMPGLINLHVHLPAGENRRKSRSKQLCFQKLRFRPPLCAILHSKSAIPTPCRGLCPALPQYALSADLTI